MKWGHSVQFGSEKVEMTRADYNRAFNVPVPESPHIPDEVEYIWDMWFRLNARRSVSESLSPLQYSEISAFLSLENEGIERLELYLIEAIDNAYLGQVAKERKGMYESQSQTGSKK